MAQVSKYPIKKEIADKIFEMFSKTIAKANSKEETEMLIKDLFTPIEQIMLAKRLAIAFLLEKGHDYRTIRTVLRVSFPTIATVNIARQYGSNGYKRLLNKIMREESISNFFDEALIKLVSLPATGKKGGGVWRYLKQELEKDKRKKYRRF